MKICLCPLYFDMFTAVFVTPKHMLLDIMVHERVGCVLNTNLGECIGLMTMLCCTLQHIIPHRSRKVPKKVILLQADLGFIVHLQTIRCRSIVYNFKGGRQVLWSGKYGLFRCKWGDIITGSFCQSEFINFELRISIPRNYSF